MLCRSMAAGRYGEDDVVVVADTGVVQRRAVAPDSAAISAPVHDDPALLAGLHPYGLQHAAALAGAVAWVHVHVQRVQAVRAVVPVSASCQGRHGPAAHLAVERLVSSSAGEQFHGSSIAPRRRDAGSVSDPGERPFVPHHG